MTSTMEGAPRTIRMTRVTGPLLTHRERAVLVAIGRRLTNPEIAGEMFVSVRTVESHIASLRRKIGAESRAALIDAATVEQGRSVDVPHNPLRGRDAELDDVAELLRDRRWVTLSGSGGVGKTRLALEVASRSDRTPIVVDLEHAAPEDIPARIARALEIESGSADPLPAIATALSMHPYLLVLDNVDRVGDSVAQIIARSRTVARDIQVLTTSRTPIGHPGEAVMVLQPLGSDGADSPAVQLLLDRLNDRGHGVGAFDQGVVERIALRLDGVPLALELAASVARHLPLSELDARLEHSFATLDRATPAGKHRTLETAFEWTWDLLTDDERDVLRSLAALPRSFDLNLAAAVTREGVEGVVLRLLDHSLLVVTDDSPRRFRLLAVLREFVHARTDPAVIRNVREQHALYTTGIAAVFTSTARTDDSPEAMKLSSILCPEVNAALRWALAADHPLASTLAAALAKGSDQYGADVDSINAIVMAGRNELVRRDATPQQLLAIGEAAAFIDIGLVYELASLAMARVQDDAGRLAALHLAGLAAAYDDRGADALTLLAEAEQLAVDLDEIWEAAAISQMRGVALAGDAVGDGEAAIVALESASRRFARAGDRSHVNNSRYLMAVIAAEHGVALDRARVWASEAAAYARSTSNRHTLAHAQLAQAMLGASEPTAEALLAEFRSFGDLRCVYRSLILQSTTVGPARRVALLEEAIGVAEAAEDRRRRRHALASLAEAEEAVGDRVSAFAALDRIAASDGAEAALLACPEILRAHYVPDITA